jgi:serine protease Do
MSLCATLLMALAAAQAGAALHAERLFLGGGLRAFAFQDPRAAPPVERLDLGGRSAVEGRVIKETEESLFVDVGFTVLGVPRSAVVARQPLEEARAEAGGEVLHEGIYATAPLERAPIQQHVARFGEAVVLVTTPSGLGSGFIIDDKNGYVVTNYHVIEQELNIAITIFVKRGRELERIKKDRVRIVAINPWLDLALLRIEDVGDTRLTKVYLGSSDDLRPGDPVFAIGNPLGLERTVSEGILSTKRTWNVMEGLLYLQTTAAINPGNSGGPLFNDRGEVIGVTNMTRLFSEGLNFAIPIDVVKDLFLKNREYFAFDKDNPNTGYRYFDPPARKKE